MMHIEHLPNQKENEKVVLFLRRNWLSVFSIVFVFSMMLIIPIVALYVLRDWVAVIMDKPVLGAIATLIASIYVLCVWLFTFLEFTDYYLDTWIVTNERILSTEQKGLFNRVASELHLAAIQDVTSEMRGMIGTFLDFGDVFIQTAGEKGRFHFDNVDHPEKIKEHIIELIEADKKRHAGSLIAAMAEGEKSPEETA